MKTDYQDSFTNEQQEVLKSIRISRIILPILLGVGVVAYLFWRNFNPEELSKINWTSHTAFWILAAFGFLVIRHLSYANRLRILSDKAFSWRKCIELIFIWEFSSAVSPTSIGGSAVALFILAQEKLSTAKTTTIVIFTAVLDTFFFIGTLPILFVLFGPRIIRPNMSTLYDLDGWGYTFIGTYLFMGLYGFLFFYGLFINPLAIKRLMVSITRLGFLRKYRHKAIELGNDIVTASREMRQRRWSYHIGAFLSTAGAWSCRFLLLNCLIIAFMPDTSLAAIEQLVLYGRLETMFVIMAFSPTPGGAGLAEIVFYGFLSDYVPGKGVALLVASIWRLLTYYLYLLIGAIIIPNWIRTVLNERKRRRMAGGKATDNPIG
ncbi:MAG: lysylphosphatidylglycerol synthase transmembrane domain-containing protein [Bacteroidota bacterium]